MEKYIVRVNGKEYEVEVEKAEGNIGSDVREEKLEAAIGNSSNAEGTVLEAGAAGKVYKILKKVGDKVEKGETIVILEAMKMEIPMVAAASGAINTVFVNEGQPVEAGDKLLTIA